MAVTLGTDPEMFAVGHTQEEITLTTGKRLPVRGKIIPAYYALGGDIELPLPHGTGIGDGGAVEFTVHPTANVPDLVERIRANIHTISDHVMAMSGAVLTVVPNAEIDAAFVGSLDKSYGKRASLQMLGCDPDKEIYGFDPVDKPDPTVYHFRTTGGHIHFGIEEAVDDPWYITYTVALLDRVLGTGSAYVSDSPESVQRMRLYGRAGCFRIDDVRQTLEYRSLPAQALIQSPRIAEVMFTAGQNIVEYTLRLYRADKEKAFDTFRQLLGSYEMMTGVAHAINTHQVAFCKETQHTFALNAPDDMNIFEPVMDMQRYPGKQRDFNIYWD